MKIFRIINLQNQGYWIWAQDQQDALKRWNGPVKSVIDQTEFFNDSAHPWYASTTRAMKANAAGFGAWKLPERNALSVIKSIAAGEPKSAREGDPATTGWHINGVDYPNVPEAA